MDTNDTDLKRQEALEKWESDEEYHRLERIEHDRILVECNRRIIELNQKQREEQRQTYNPLTHGLEENPQHDRDTSFLKLFQIK